MKIKKIKTLPTPLSFTRHLPLSQTHTKLLSLPHTHTHTPASINRHLPPASTLQPPHAGVCSYSTSPSRLTPPSLSLTNSHKFPSLPLTHTSLHQSTSATDLHTLASTHQRPQLLHIPHSPHVFTVTPHSLHSTQICLCCRLHMPASPCDLIFSFSRWPPLFLISW